MSLYFLLTFPVIWTPNTLNRNIPTVPTSSLMSHNNQEFLRWHLLLLWLHHFTKNSLWYFGITSFYIVRVNGQSIFLSFIYSLCLSDYSATFKTQHLMVTPMFSWILQRAWTRFYILVFPGFGVLFLLDLLFGLPEFPWQCYCVQIHFKHVPFPEFSKNEAKQDSRGKLGFQSQWAVKP